MDRISHNKLTYDVNRDIAIVGISVYTPAGEDVSEFWDSIAGGGDFITDAPPEVLESYHFEGKPNGIDRFYCKKGGFCKPFKVDPLRYGILPIAADGVDPDQLMALAGAEWALADAGVFDKGVRLSKGSIIIGKGNFSGNIPLRSAEIIRSSQQFVELLSAALPHLTEADLNRIRKEFQVAQGRYQADMIIGTMPNLVASLVANKFDLQGPAYTVDAACASGIVAINHSVELLRSGRSDIALVGGMHMSHSAMFWGAFDMLGAMSRKQRIAPFSAEADGLLVGHGQGFLVLKTLGRALADDDRIYAVIKDTAVASDGAGTHVMVTTSKGQIRVLEQAWAASGVDPDLVSYIEAHGTATPVGDPVEIATLKTFFGDDSKRRAYLGSIKSNIGHTMPAAGMIGVIKTALSLYNKVIPPTLNCENPSPALAGSRFTPPQAAIPWEGDDLPLVAGVNAFGFGGINSHAILTAWGPEGHALTGGVPQTAAAPEVSERDGSILDDGSPCVRPYALPRLSKKPKPYLGRAIMASAPDGEALVQKLRSGDYTHTGGDWRVVVFDATEERIEKAVSIIERGEPWHSRLDVWFSNKPFLKEGGKIVYMVPGAPAYMFGEAPESDSISECFDLPYRADLVAEQCEASSPDAIIWEMFFMEALALHALRRLGVDADIYTGHSMGEWGAITLAGMTYSDDWKTLNDMIKSSEAAKPYPALLVGGVPLETVEQWCAETPGLYMSNDNCPSQTMLCGERAVTDAFAKRLDERHIFYTQVEMPPYHTPIVADWLKGSQSFLERVEVKEGRAPVWSSTSLEQVPTTKKEYMELAASHLLRPVRFRQLVEKLYEEQGARMFIQLGSGVLTNFVDDTLKGRDFVTISTAQSERGAADQLRRVLAALFVSGREVDAAFMGVSVPYRVAHSVIKLPQSPPPILRSLSSLTNAVKERYGDGASPFSFSPAADAAGDPILQAAAGNLRDAAFVQDELLNLYKGAMGAAPRAAGPAPEAGGLAPQAAPARAATASGAADPAVAAALAAASGEARPKAGDSFVDRMTLSFDDHPYLVDHSIVRQPDGWECRDDLNLVVPFTMTIELLTEMAARHAPGRILTSIGNMAAMHWISLEKPFDQPVKGRWKSPDVLNLEVEGYVRADVTFADERPKPPPELEGPIDVGPPIMEPWPAWKYYDRYSFHGPQYQTCTKTIRVGERGMICGCEKKAGKGSLLDSMGQQLGTFLHLTQTVDTISFPVTLKDLTFYYDVADQEGEFELTLIVTRLTDKLLSGDMVLKRGGRVWSVARGFVCHRFGNIPEVWDILLKPHIRVLAKEPVPGLFLFENDNSEAIVGLLEKRYLNADDREKRDSLKSGAGKRELLTGRVALKDAVRRLAARGGEEMIYPVEIYVRYDDQGKPSVWGPGRAEEALAGVHVSLAHKGRVGVATAAFAPTGVDVERIEEKDAGFMEAAFTEAERELLKSQDALEGPIRFWTAKEACSKMVGDGLRGNGKRYEVVAADGERLTVRRARQAEDAGGAETGATVRTMHLPEGYIIGWTEQESAE
ncbi:MAG: 4'-phosphopantetheinyl transferase superfamily protein [Clostridiales Family XIII bacterium]|jgi:acyl transferase domain-containing protein/phosphopantetheinyl transferase|nr:4'-phosphopantetheinyl transferase superfamily protein [Clostridiales Family XIII bacterium]